MISRACPVWRSILWMEHFWARRHRRARHSPQCITAFVRWAAIGRDAACLSGRGLAFPKRPLAPEAGADEVKQAARDRDGRAIAQLACRIGARDQDEEKSS